eukprot:gene12768-14079_t
MGCCLSNKFVTRKTDQTPDARPKQSLSTTRNASLQPPEDFSNNGNVLRKLSSGRGDRLSSAKSRSSNGPELEPSYDRQKKLSICSSYSDRPLHNIPSEIPEDCILTVHDFFNIINDGSLNPYIHEEGNFLLVDCRKQDQYTTLHVATATHHSELDSDPNFQSGVGYSMFNIIIIYGDNIRKGESKDIFKIWHGISMMVAGDVLVLIDGFRLFQEKFPFMCMDTKINFAWERRNIVTYPSVVINDKLYQGTGIQATNLNVVQNLKITHIINITKEHGNAFPEKINYLRFPIEDEKGSNVLKYFQEASDFIENAFSKKGVVFVHCNLGVSRSSSITLAYLMKSQKINLEDAYNFLKSRRSCIKPNIGFLTQLSEWELKILGGKITSIDNLF